MLNPSIIASYPIELQHYMYIKYWFRKHIVCTRANISIIFDLFIDVYEC